MSVKVGGWLAGTGSLLPSPKGTNSGHQNWWQASLVALSHFTLLSSGFSELYNLNSLELKWPSEASGSTWITVTPTFLPVSQRNAENWENCLESHSALCQLDAGAAPCRSFQDKWYNAWGLL